MFVYKDYDQQSLDAQYNNRLHVPDYADYFNRWESLSRQTAQKLPVTKDVCYGNLLRERLDIYPSLLPQSKTLIFIHGGYWQMLDKSMFQFIADGFYDYGVTTVLLSYPLAPQVSMDQIVFSCRKAIQWLYKNVSTFNGDPDQMYVAGHSAGGHLAAMLMATDWQASDTSISSFLLKGVCTVSGLFDLIPVHLSYLNKIIKMDIEAAKRNSPVRLEPLNTCPLIVAVGEAETAAFNDQSSALYSCWTAKAIDIRFLCMPGLHHFSIVESITDRQSSLHAALRNLMKIG